MHFCLQVVSPCLRSHSLFFCRNLEFEIAKFCDSFFGGHQLGANCAHCCCANWNKTTFLKHKTKPTSETTILLQETQFWWFWVQCGLLGTFVGLIFFGGGIWFLCLLLLLCCFVCGCCCSLLFGCLVVVVDVCCCCCCWCLLFLLLICWECCCWLFVLASWFEFVCNSHIFVISVFCCLIVSFLM